MIPHIHSKSHHVIYTSGGHVNGRIPCQHFNFITSFNSSTASTFITGTTISLIMFSPALGDAPAASLRSTRRRRRERSAESQAPPSKRHRGTLNDKTFVAPDALANVDKIKASRQSTLLQATPMETTENETASRDMVMRSKKSKLGDRGSKGDGSLLLVRLYDIREEIC